MPEPRAPVTVRVEPFNRELLSGVPVGEDARAEDKPGFRRRVCLAVIPYFADERPLQGLGGLIDWRLNGQISDFLRNGWCSGAEGEALLFPGRGGIPFDRLVLIGLGPTMGLAPECAADKARAVVDVVTRLLPRSVLLALPQCIDERERVEALFLGVCWAVKGVSQREDDGGEFAPDASTQSVSTSPAVATVPWWIAADPEHVGRLRSLLEGPLRAARG